MELYTCYYCYLGAVQQREPFMIVIFVFHRFSFMNRAVIKSDCFTAMFTFIRVALCYGSGKAFVLILISGAWGDLLEFLIYY